MYFFYLDESGQRAYNSKDDIFVLQAVAVSEHQWQAVNACIEDVKRAHFPALNPDQIELKSSSIRNRRGIFRRMSVAKITAFTDDLYDIITSSDLTLLAVVVRKSLVFSRYLFPEDPYLLAYKMLIERAQTFLEQRTDASKGIIVSDNFSNIQSRGRRMAFERKVRRQHKAYLRDGTEYKEIDRIIEDPFYVDSRFNNFIQVADLCAYNVFRRYQYDQPNYPYFARIYSKFFRSRTGRVEGYGLKIFPGEKN